MRKNPFNFVHYCIFAISTLNACYTQEMILIFAWRYLKITRENAIFWTLLHYYSPNFENICPLGQIYHCLTEKTVYALFRTQYEKLCYPDALWTCLVVTNNLILYLLFYSHYTSNLSPYILFDNWYTFIHNTYEYLFMKSGCYWELTWFILSI